MAEPTSSSQSATVVSPVKKKSVVAKAMPYIGVLLFLFAGLKFAQYLQFSRTHATTDDAYVTGDFVNVSPLILGTLSHLSVKEGDFVKKGQLIARLEDSQQIANVQQAEAAYKLALEQIPQAQTSLTFQSRATKASIDRAKAALAAQRARTQGANAQLKVIQATTKNQAEQARAQISAAQAARRQAQAQVTLARAAHAASQRAVEAASHGVSALQSKLAAAQAEVQRTSADVERYQRLLSQEAVTQQQFDVVSSQAVTAQSNLATLQRQIEQANSQLDQAREGVQQAAAQVTVAEQATQSADQQIKVAEAGLGVAVANTGQVNVQSTNVNVSSALDLQSSADIQTAQAGESQVTLQNQKVSSAQVQAQQAKATLEFAKVQLRNTYIYAPEDGQVVRKTANVGTSLSPGQTIVTLAQSGKIWVTANFKETQLTNIRVGQSAEIEVDAFPGHKIKAVVASINQATGATTSLLPPDNATGNFTKVVQRIPVRLTLKPDDITPQISQGMSVSASIDIEDRPATP